MNHHTRHRSWQWKATVYAYRYCSGRPLDGKMRTDCGYLRPGRTIKTESGHASQWAHFPGWKRQVWRLGVPATGTLTTIGYLEHPVPTTATAVGITGYLGYRAFRKAHHTIRTWHFRRNTVQPLLSAVAPFAEMQPLELERHAVVQPAEVRIPMPPHHSGQAAKLKDIERIVSQRMGGEWDLEANFRAAPFYLRFTPTPAPPSYVTLDDVYDAIVNTTESKPILGLGTRGQVLTLDFEGEIAHLATSIGTGGGKSSFLRLLVAQFSYHGVRDIEIIDVKQVSLAGLEQIPGVRYHRHIEEIWTAVERIKHEMDLRYERLLMNAKATFPRKVVILEEQNAFEIESKVRWDQIKPKGAKRTPPVYDDLALLLTKARQVNINLVSMYQRMTASAAGGGVMRDQYGLKLLSRFSPQAWDTLVGTRPRGASSTVPGRAIAIMGAQHRTVQLPFVTTEQAIELALSSPHVTVTREQYEQVRVPSHVTVTSEERLYTLKEASEEPWCSVSYDTLRQRASRARRAGKMAPATSYTQDDLMDLLAKDVAA